jgi:large subunit ribosomal protein L1
MGKKKTAIVGDFLSEEDQQKQERMRRQKEAEHAARLASESRQASKAAEAKQPTAEKAKTHVAGQKGGERVKDLSAEIMAEAEEVERKTREAQAAAAGETKKTETIRRHRGSLGRGKIYQAAKSKVENKYYSISEALKLLRDISYTKFTPTVEVHLTVTQPGNSASVDLPYSTGKTKRIALADDTTIADIEKGLINFDVLLASPAQMPKIVRLAKVLGPRGLMPNPKNGTIVDDPQAAAKKLADSATVLLKTEKSAPIIHTVAGKLSQNDEELSANIRVLLAAFGNDLTKATLKSTMSPGIKLELPR